MPNPAGWKCAGPTPAIAPSLPPYPLLAEAQQQQELAWEIYLVVANTRAKCIFCVEVLVLRDEFKNLFKNNESHFFVFFHS